MIRALIDHLWQSTLFGAAIWSITLALRSNSAAVRHGLWLLASLKFLVPFSALYLAGAAAGLVTPVEAEPTLFGAAVQAATPMISPSLSFSVNAPSKDPALLFPGLAAPGPWLHSVSACAGCATGARRICFPGQRGRRRAHCRMRASRTRMSNPRSHA